MIFKDQLKNVDFASALEYLAKSMLNDVEMLRKMAGKGYPASEHERIGVEYMEAIGVLVHNTETAEPSLDGLCDYRIQGEHIMQKAREGKIPCIKAVREEFGVGLAEAKKAVEEAVAYNSAGSGYDFDGMKVKEWVLTKTTEGGDVERFLIWRKGASRLDDSLYPMNVPF